MFHITLSGRRSRSTSRNKLLLDEVDNEISRGSSPSQQPSQSPGSVVDGDINSNRSFSSSILRYRRSAAQSQVRLSAAQSHPSSPKKSYEKSPEKDPFDEYETHMKTMCSNV